MRDHPVISALVRLRAYLEKIKPIDAKIKYQIDKLLKAGSGKGTAEGDALSLRPNPAALGAGAADGEQEEEAEPEAGKSVYRPPRLAPAFFEDDGKASHHFL